MSEEAEEGDDAEGSPLPQGEAIGAAGAISAINDINAVGTIDAGGAADAAGAIDVVVLAGGTGRRLGGASKPDVVARGLRLLDHVLAGLEHLRTQGLPLGRVCVVAPPEVALPCGVLRALEVAAAALGPGRAGSGLETFSPFKKDRGLNTENYTDLSEKSATTYDQKPWLLY